MIFEYLFNPKFINKQPKVMIVIGFLYASIALLLASVVFRAYASVVMVFFSVMALLPIVYSSIKHEEHEDMVLNNEKNMLEEHGKALGKFMYLFFGLVLAFSFWYSVLPMDLNSELYEAQIATISQINGPQQNIEDLENIDDRRITDDQKVTGEVVRNNFPVFVQILTNNTVVLMFCLIFSLLYGLGAIFILTWNASVIGVAIGSIVKEGISASVSLIGFSRIISYVQVISYGLLRFTLHGIPEIAAYFIGGLAGGIISIAVIKHDYRSKKFKKVLTDSIDLAIISILLLVVAAVVEVYFTPIFF